MCTAISFQTKDHYFGRNLDLEYAYQEAITITPRKYPFIFRETSAVQQHYALIGMATVVDNYPLYYDATNEFGLSMAGLNFPGNAIYLPLQECATNIAPFELIPWLLSRCKTVNEARDALKEISLADISFSDALPSTPLHWILADSAEAIVIEPGPDGIKIFNNPIGVLTNNPPFDFHMHHLSSYINLTRDEPTNRFSDQTQIKPYSRGMGAMGLPGDLSSASRFIKAAFTKLNAVCDPSENASVSQFFHILTSVEQQRGCVRVGDKYELTLYSSCCNTTKGIYYYTTYENRQITAVSLHNENLDGEGLIIYPLLTEQQIFFQN